MLPLSRILVRQACSPVHLGVVLRRQSTESEAVAHLRRLLRLHGAVDVDAAHDDTNTPGSPSRATCRAAITTLSTRGELQQAQVLLEAVTRAGISLAHDDDDDDDDELHQTPPLAASSSLLRRSALGHHPVRPLEHVLRRLKPRSYRMYTKLQASRLRDYVRAAALAGAPVSGELHALMVRCYCRRRETAAAVSLVRDMVDAGVAVDASLHYHPILRVFSDAGRAVEARELLREMREQACLEPDATSHMLVLEGFIRARDFDAARLVLLRMLQLGLEFDESALRALVCGFCDALQSQKALRTLRDMIDVGVAPERALFYRVLDALGHAGNLAGMRALLDDMAAVGFDRLYEIERLKQSFSISFFGLDTDEPDDYQHTQHSWL